MTKFIWIPLVGIIWKPVIDKIPEGSGIEDEQYNWLVNKLVENPMVNKIVFMHHPVVCCWDYHNYNEDCWNGCIMKNRGNIVSRLRDPNNDGSFDDSVKVVLNEHTHEMLHYTVSPSNSVTSFDLLEGEYVNTDSIEDGELPLYIITDAAGEDMGYRKIEVLGENIRVYNNGHFSSTVKYECDWIPWYKDKSGFDRNGENIEPTGRLHVYDSNGNHVGINDTGGIDFEIESAYYEDQSIYNETGKYNWTDGELISVRLGENDYVYLLEALENSTLNLTGQFTMDNEGWIRLSYLNITAFNGSIGKLFINDRSYDFILYWDDDGDGSIDREIEPTEIITPPPYKPAKPHGPTSGKPGEEYTYTTSTTDPNSDRIHYLWDWGDGTDSGWLGPYNSGETAEASHKWTKKEDFNIKVKAKDIYDCESDWSDPLIVSITKNKNRIINMPFLNFLENHPILYQLLLRFLRL